MENAVAPSVRVAYVIAEVNAFFTYITFCHDETSLKDIYTKFVGFLTQHRYFIKS